MLTYTWKNTVTVPGLPSLPADAPVLITGDYAAVVEIAVAAGATDVLVTVGTIDYDLIQCIVINADLAAMDIYTNDVAGSGGQHFALAANKSVAWHNQMPSNVTNPITTDITKFYANNAGTKAGVLRVGVLLNTNT